MARSASFLVIVCALFAVAGCKPTERPGGQLRFSLHAEPKTLDPLLAIDGAGETINFATGGVLLRINRKTQQFEPELAESYKVSNDRKSITFQLRPNVKFSNGRPFSAEDVAFTIRRVSDPALNSPNGDNFRVNGTPATVAVLGPLTAEVRFPTAMASMESLFDAIPIQSAEASEKNRAVLGPFQIAEYTPGVSIRLARNPHYWKRDAQGKILPYLEGMTTTFQRNRDIELQQFRRGEVQIINGMDPEQFEQLRTEAPKSAVDGGPSLEGEQLWFNMSPTAPIPPYKRAWFATSEFRRAVSMAVNRSDLVRIVYHGHAQVAAGPTSAMNKVWFNQKLAPMPHDPDGAMQNLTSAGFVRQGSVLYDRERHPVEFSILTTGGNKAREKMGALIQQDLAQIGIKVNLVSMDAHSLIERFTETYAFDTVLVGLTNIKLDPADQMNIWLSSAPNHQWNPNQKTPATPWEAEIDRMMLTFLSVNDQSKRKAAFDRVQEIVRREQPMVDLLYKNSLCAVAPSVGNADPVALVPQTLWNREFLFLRPGK